MITEHRTSSGFTLVEILLAIMIASMAMVAVSGTFISTLRARDEIETLANSTEAGQRILTLIERDLRGLWHHNIKHNAILIGRDLDVAGYDADRIDFLTTTDAIGGVLDDKGRLIHPTICEVGYWLKENREIPGLLELWRREDPMVDGDLLTEGHFQLVCDRLKSLNIEYYETLGYEAEPLTEWNSSTSSSLPRRLKIEFTVHRKLGNRNQVAEAEIADYESTLKTYVRHIVFDRRFVDVLSPGIAMIPVIPSPPEGSSGDGPGGPAGPAGPAGPGRSSGDTSIEGRGNARTTRGGGRGTRGGRNPLEGGNLGDLNNLLRGGRGGGGGLFGGGRGGGGGGR